MTLYHGDCLEVMRTMPDCSVDSVVTDPPYGLSFMDKRWDYDVPSVDIWRECLRVLKPGGHLLAFAGTRTQHRMAVNIEDAGFEIRDMIAWCYGQGFPKSQSINKALGDSVCLCRGSALPYTHEEAVSREPQAERAVCAMRDADVPPSLDLGERRRQILQQGLQEQSAPANGTMPIEGDEGLGQSSLERRSDSVQEKGQLHGRDLRSGAPVGSPNGSEGRLCDAAPSSDGRDVRLPVDQGGSGQPQGPQPQQQRPVESGAVSQQRGPQAGRGWQVCGGCGKPMVPEGWGTALKPALEPITVARKPFKGTVAQNVLEHGTGGINIDGCRIAATDKAKFPAGVISDTEAVFGGGQGRYANRARTADSCPDGRWPANLIHDGSEEVTQLFPDAGGGFGKRGATRQMDGWGMGGNNETVGYGDSGSAARFFYCAKASKADREDGNVHPTVKPVELMAYLCRLVTPPGGIVLDPFMGSGSTIKAALSEGFCAIGIERDPSYYAIAERRLNSAQLGLPMELEP